MKAKTFFLAALSCALLLLAGSAGVVLWADPMLAQGLEEGETAVFTNERYQMAGLIRHQDYSQVVVGTSLVANYRASWFTEGTGEKTLKISFPDGWISEFDTALELVFRTHPEVDRVYFCLDPNILIRPEAERTVELPEYFYNLNPFDDVEYLLNADSLTMAVKTLLQGEEAKVPLDEAYVWDKNFVFSVGSALAGYPRPETVEPPIPGDSYLAAAEQNMDVVCGWAEQHPEAQFVVWFPPYSVLYWDQMQRLGKTEAILSALEYAMDRLLDHGNVRVYSFLNAQGITTDLGQYTDHVHCSGAVTAWETESMLKGGWQVWKDIVPGVIEELRRFVTSYDYDGIYTKYGWVDGKPPGGSFG